MNILKYYCYNGREKPNLWSNWYHEQDEAVQAKHDNVFEFLEANDDWRLPQYRRLGGFGNIGEVRIKAKVQWRIFGFRRGSEGNKEFVVVHVGHHKQNVYKPKKVREQSEKRMKEIQNDPRKANRCNRPGQT